jgi:hypothetical protein
MKDNNPAQLWKEEPERLCNYASLVPHNGTIVEIGTADGGSAKLLFKATKDKNIKIYTIDVSPTRKAFELLRDTGVIIVKNESSNYSKIWKNEIKRKIDFLFIDGDHSFESVYADFYSWLPHLNSQAIIVFHDYDPPHRGGIAHLGIQIFLETLLANEILIDTSHDFRFLFGRINDENNVTLTIGNYFELFLKLGKGIESLKEKIFRHSLEESLDMVKNRAFGMTSLQACYCLEPMIHRNLEFLIESTPYKQKVRQWVEMLAMFQHANGPFLFPEKRHLMSVPANPHDLSKLIALEHVKANILKNVLKTIVLWEP